MTDYSVCVNLTSDIPIYRKMQRMGEVQEQQARWQVQQDLSMKIVEPSVSEYSSNITWATKADGSLRMCVNYAPIKELTVKDRFPLARQETIIERLRGYKYLALMAYRLGFHNWSLHPADRHMLAFSTSFGLFQYIRLPFGWCNEPPEFQRQYTITLGTIVTWWVKKDVSEGDRDNHRAYDNKLVTLLFNG